MTRSDPGLVPQIRLRSAVALVIANMIGAGIFTTTGFQAADLGHPGMILSLWVVGGVLALCGALCYSELGAAMPRAGGEYHYLRQTYGDAVGFMSAFVSLVAGFSAPIASALKSVVRYASHCFPFLAGDPLLLGVLSVNDLIAVGLTWLLVGIHCRRVTTGIAFSDWITALKVGGIVLIIVGAAAIGRGDLSGLTAVSTSFQASTVHDRFAAFGTSLIFVMFCYSGWNAAAYIAGEIQDPQRNLPRALLLGTATVLILYLGLNAVYFYGAGVEGLAGKVEVGLVAARGLFGPVGVTLVTLVLTVSILASASAMTIAGPRVYYALGRDFHLFRFLAAVSPSTSAPTTALLLQGLVTSVIIVIGRVDQIQQYAGFTLSLFASLAVSCVIVLRLREPNLLRPFRTWGYPLAPLLFVAVSAWMMFWAFQGRPVESTLALSTVLAGGMIFWVAARRRGREAWRK